MYSNRHRKKIFLFRFICAVLLLPYNVFGLDLLEEITLKVQSIYDGGTFDDYLNRAYVSEYSNDPFGDAMSSISDRATKVKKSGEDYVKKSLDFDGCYMSKKEIRGILYYYLTGYRSDISRTLKIEKGDYDSRKYEIDKNTVDKYCSKFADCVKYGPRNMETNCMEFFQKNYRAGEYNEKMKQDVEVSQLGADKYWNNSTDDSPYDIMEDLGVLSKLLYMEAQDPIKPVFYDVPAFSYSKQDLKDKKDSASVSDEDSGAQNVGEGKDNNNPQGKPDSPNVGGDKSIPDNNPSASAGSDDVLEYDNLLEGLGAYALSSDGSEFYTNLCDNREEQEIEEELETNEVLEAESVDLDNLSEEQYQEIVDYMLNAVNQYSSLSPDKEDEIEKKIGDKSDFGGEASAEGLQRRIEQVKNCYDSCRHLRIDQRASCMVKCACGEINSPIFNPDKTPGLGPIFMIKFCAVPGVDMRFSVGGKRIHSIEEGVREIYGVVDKLSREGRLGTWTQQYEFLDASTKRINFADSIAFSIDVEFVDIGKRAPKSSEQYEKKELKKSNEESQRNFGVSNKTDTTDGRNSYRVILGDELNENVDRDKTSQKTKADLGAGSQYSKNVNEDENAIRYTQIESHRNLWLDQQSQLRKNVFGYIEDLKNQSKFLEQRKKQCKRN